MAESDENRVHCSFCGVEKSAQAPLISGNEGRICEACVQLAHQVVSSWGQRRKNMQSLPKMRHPAAIKKHLDEYVIGQERAKKVLALAVFNHYLRMLHHDKPFCQHQEHVELEKSNMLLLGPSGSGKTLMVRSLAKLLGVPFAMCDATSLTQAGYVGEDVESIVQRLLEAAAGDVQLAQWLLSTSMK